MFNLETTDDEFIPANKLETETLKRKCFNEGWWKAFRVTTVATVVGVIIGGILGNIIVWKLEEKA